MADDPSFPRWLFPAGGPPEPDYGGCVFESQAELDAAEGQWYATPQEAQAAEPEPTPVAHPRSRR